jgi:hypothetical protein
VDKETPASTKAVAIAVPNTSVQRCSCPTKDVEVASPQVQDSKRVARPYRHYCFADSNRRLLMLLVSSELGSADSGLYVVKFCSIHDETYVRT